MGENFRDWGDRGESGVKAEMCYTAAGAPLEMASSIDADLPPHGYLRQPLCTIGSRLSQSPDNERDHI